MPLLERSLRPQARPRDLVTRRTPAPPEGQPAVVRQEATRLVHYDPTRPRLIGVFGKEDAPQALIRLPSGRMAEVRRGDRIGPDTVAAIEAGSVILRRNGRTERLALPAA